MKKNIINSALITALVLGSAQFAQVSLADGMPYEPIFESMPINESISSAKVQTVPATYSTVSKSSAQVNTNANPTIDAANSVESGNLQNALMQLDSAQVEIRNTLIQCKTEYTDIDNEYKTVKEKRKLKNKQVKETEKKIKNLDKTKEKIRKSM